MCKHPFVLLLTTYWLVECKCIAFFHIQIFCLLPDYSASFY